MWFPPAQSFKSNKQNGCFKMFMEFHSSTVHSSHSDLSGVAHLRNFDTPHRTEPQELRIKIIGVIGRFSMTSRMLFPLPTLLW